MRFILALWLVALLGIGGCGDDDADGGDGGRPTDAALDTRQSLPPPTPPERTGCALCEDDEYCRSDLVVSAVPGSRPMDAGVSCEPLGACSAPVSCECVAACNKGCAETAQGVSCTRSAM